MALKLNIYTKILIDEMKIKTTTLKYVNLNYKS